MTPETGFTLFAKPGQPETLFQALEEETRQRVGHKLFTLLYADGDEVARIYSNRPEEYPVSGRKRIRLTPWGEHVLQQKKPFVGSDVAAIRWAFADHALIESMGLGAVINLPVIYDGSVLGTFNMLDAEHAYSAADAEKVADLAPLLVPAFLAARFAARSAPLTGD